MFIGKNKDGEEYILSGSKNLFVSSLIEFLKDYDSNKFEKLSMTTDILIFSVSDEVQENYRKLNKKYFSVLLVKRDNSSNKGVLIS